MSGRKNSVTDLHIRQQLWERNRNSFYKSRTICFVFKWLAFIYTLFYSGGHSELIILNIHKLEVLKKIFFTIIYLEIKETTLEVRRQLAGRQYSVPEIQNVMTDSTFAHEASHTLEASPLLLPLVRWVQPWLPCNYAEDQAGLKLVVILPPLPPKWWDNRDALSCLTQTLLFLHIHNTIIYLDVCMYVCLCLGYVCASMHMEVRGQSAFLGIELGTFMC